MGQVGVPALQAGKVGQKKGDVTPGRFLNAHYFLSRHRPVQHPCLDLSQKPETSGRDSFPLGSK